MSELCLRVEGPAAEAVAAEIARAVEAEFGVAPGRRAVTRRPGEDERAVDPVALAALIVSIPSGVLAAMDLAERIRLKPRLEALLARIRAAVPPGVAVRVETKEGLKDVAGVNAEDLIDAGR